MTRKRGFTLIEILIVVGIVAALAAILLPSLSGAKKRALNTTALSNLRQCYLALCLYTDGEITYQALPDKNAAWLHLGKDVTRDPADWWRKGDTPSPYEAMVGSFAYGNAKLCRDSGTKRVPCIQDVFGKNYPLLLSIFYNETPFLAGEHLDPTDASPLMPKRALVLWVDGHVKNEAVAGSGREYFTWAVLFHKLSLKQREN